MVDVSPRLIFIGGSPRSGTSRAVNLIGQHPSVFHATSENMGLSVGATTEGRLFTLIKEDSELKNKVRETLMRSGSKFLVEKTPNNVAHSHRIKKLFPKSTFVLCVRDGRDVITSMLRIGRRKKKFWKTAPTTAALAFGVWAKYAIASDKCLDHANPIVLHYEDALRDPIASFATVFYEVGISISEDEIAQFVKATDKGKGIPIEGVFNKGRSGDWEEYLTGEEIDVIENLRAKACLPWKVTEA